MSEFESRAHSPEIYLIATSARAAKCFAHACLYNISWIMRTTVVVVVVLLDMLHTYTAITFYCNLKGLWVAERTKPHNVQLSGFAHAFPE